MNNDGESDAGFNYYKHFLKVGDTLGTPPPIAINGRQQHKWMKTNCPLSDPYRGTELDWMGFYFAIHTTGASSVKYTYANIKDVYEFTCGGSCYELTSPWTDQVGAAQAVFGIGSAKATHWQQKGIGYGVDQ